MFSKITILELVKALDFNTRNEIDEFAIRFDIEDEVSGKYIQDKQTSIVGYLVANPNQLGKNSSNLQYEFLSNGTGLVEGFWKDCTRQGLTLDCPMSQIQHSGCIW